MPPAGHAFRRAGRTVRGTALLLAVWLASGCATYTAVRPGSVEPGQEVRITLDPAASPELAEFVLQDGARVLIGRVAQRGAEGLTVDVASAVRERGLHSEVLRQRVVISEREIVGLEIRRVDVARTAIVVGLGAAVAIAVVALIHSGTVGGSGEGLPNPPPQRVPSR